MIIESLFIGMLIGFLYYEWTGISPGGVVAPGYFALFLREPSRIGMTVLLALIVAGILELLSRRLLVYGRRKLLLALLLGFCLKLTVDLIVQPMPVIAVDLHSIGYILPGLIGNEITRQRVVPTLAGITVVTVCTALVLILLR